ncbi:cytochrome P450 [Nocardia transvalensis]|uniref:Cytochrome P450 n=1 Tax=Nocardia transvalensis TaxID=37333 RepID=A0A7W9PIB1_9NOCA|nr:cytochrome P450 [Nocardia transvalensis]MBB5916028.1 cytochrome P450 [Nocardia transvalensis]
MTQGHKVFGVRAAAILADLGLAAVTSGVIARRRRTMGLLERLQADRRAVTRMRQLRREYGRGPIELVLPGRRVVVLLDPADVGTVLRDAPEPFHPANREKFAALRQFQPHGVLISDEPIRDQRRAANETVLDTSSALHRLAEPFTRIIGDEAQGMAESALRRGHVDAAEFTVAWWRLVRRLVLGVQARDDDAVTDDLWRLRSAANWSFLAPPRARLRERFFSRLYRYVEIAEPDSLAGALARTPAPGGVDPVGQIPHWLFAFDAAGIAVSRALAVLATHPEHHARAVADAADPDVPGLRNYLRACVLESVRLWPTTPAILRDTTEPTTWGDEGSRFTIDGGAALLIAVPAFHRDPDLPFADAFTPDIWLDGTAEKYPQLVPFGDGPAGCPGRNLVLFTTSTLLAHLVTAMEFRLNSHPRPAPDAPLPLTFNNFGLDFAVAPAPARIP